METNAAFVGADGVVVLDAVTHVGLHIAFVVDPVYAELDDAIRNTKALDEVGPVKFGVLVVFILNGSQNLADSLDILRLIWKSSLKIFHNIRSFHSVNVLSKNVNLDTISLNLLGKVTHFYLKTAQIVIKFTKKVEKSKDCHHYPHFFQPLCR